MSATYLIGVSLTNSKKASLMNSLIDLIFANAFSISLYILQGILQLCKIKKQIKIVVHLAKHLYKSYHLNETAGGNGEASHGKRRRGEASQVELLPLQSLDGAHRFAWDTLQIQTCRQTYIYIRMCVCLCRACLGMPALRAPLSST